MQRLKSQTGMHFPPLPYPLMKNSSKLPRVEYQTAPPPRVDPYDEYKYRVQKLTSPTQANQPSAATRKKIHQKLKELVKQRRRGHYKVKYILPTTSNTPVQYQSTGN